MEKTEINIKYMVFLSVVAAIGGFLYGYDTAVISGTISIVAEQFRLDTMQQGWYVGCALIGSIAGVACAGIIGDKAGRKNAMIISAIMFTISAAGCAIAESFNALVAYRIIGGVGIGIVSIISPLYISEMSIAKYRGRLVSLYQLAITVGFVGAYLANYALLRISPLALLAEYDPIIKIFGAEYWRGMLGMETIPAIIFLIIIFFIPESPRWMLLKNDFFKAEKIISKIYTEKATAHVEIESIKTSLGKEKKSEWKELSKPWVIKAILIGVAIAILGQFMGVNAVLYYGPSIFKESGITSGDSLLYQVMIGSVNMLTTVLALVIIDKVGRKKLVYYGVSGMMFSLIMISFYFIFGQSAGIPAIILLAFFLLYIFCCAISICAVIWVLLSEMYPTRIRGVAMSIAGFSLWIGTYLIGQLTPWMLVALTPAGTFLLFAAMCIPYLLIMRFLMSETTGLSLEEIESLWTKNKN